MKKLILKKSIAIQAPKEKVWKVLQEDEFLRIWYSAFKEGTIAETDWKLGSKAVFKDETGNGMIGKIIILIPHEIISIEYDGLLADGKEDYDSEFAKAVKGGKETYVLSQHGTVTTLEIEGEGNLDKDFLDYLSAAWDQALLIIKQLSEK